MSRCAQDTVNARSMNIPDFRVAGKLWPIGPPSKLGMGHFWADFSVKVDRLVGSGAQFRNMGSREWALLSVVLCVSSILFSTICGAFKKRGSGATFEADKCCLCLWRVPWSVKFVLITNTWDSGQLMLWSWCLVHGSVSVCNVGKPVVLLHMLWGGRRGGEVGANFHQKQLKLNILMTVLGSPSPHDDSKEKILRCPELPKNRGPKRSIGQSSLANLYTAAEMDDAL